MRERTRLDTAIDTVRDYERRLEDALTLIELGEAEDDEASIAEAERDLGRLGEEAAKRQLESLLSGEADANDCYLEVHAGAGGTESQDWTEMLMRMYGRWSDAHGYKTALIEESSWVRSRMSAWAASWSFQRLGSSARAFSSSRRLSAASQSKMPPQQAQGLLDLVDHGLGLGAHARYSCTNKSWARPPANGASGGHRYRARPRLVQRSDWLLWASLGAPPTRISKPRARRAPGTGPCARIPD